MQTILSKIYKQFKKQWEDNKIETYYDELHEMDELRLYKNDKSLKIPRAEFEVYSDYIQLDLSIKRTDYRNVPSIEFRGKDKSKIITNLLKGDKILINKLLKTYKILNSNYHENSRVEIGNDIDEIVINSLKYNIILELKIIKDKIYNI